MRYTYVRQHDTTDCAAASLAMVCLHYKKEITITRLRDMMGTDMKGTNLVGLQKAANELGFNTAAVRVDRENFLSDFTLPCIAQVITDQGLTHFVVIFKKTTIKDDDARRKHVLKEEEKKADASKKYKCKDYVVIGDPAKDLEKISLDDFYKNFTGVLLLMNPTSEFKGGKAKKAGTSINGTSTDANAKGDKSTGKYHMLKRYIDLLWPQKKLFIYAILCSVILTVIGIVSTVFNKALMDEVLPYGLKNLLITLILVFSVVNLTSNLLSTVREWILIFLSIRIDIPLMLGYFGHVFKLPMKFFATRKTGEITTRYSDASTIKSVFTSIALSVVMDIVMACATGVILFRMNATLFSISIFTTLLSILLVFIFKQPFKRINEETMQQSAILNSQMIESLRGIETVKCNAEEDRELEALEREYIKSLKISLRSSKISTVQSLISTLITTILGMVTSYVGIMQVLNGEMTLGGYMAFSTLSSYFTNPVSELVSLQMSIQQAQISIKRLTEIMDYESEQDETREYTEMEKIDGDIEFKDVSFRYLPDRPLIEGLNLDVKPGQRIAIVGPTGCGKTTLINLLMRFYDVNGGSITVSGDDIRNVTRASLRGSYGMVLQDTWLRAGTVRENIAYGKPDATDEEIVAAAKAAHADSFIRRLPDGYDTVIAEDGGNISQGQKQLLCIARVMLCLPPMLILDEATSSIDTRTEVRIQAAFARMMQGRTSFIVAHRLSTIREADVILVMKDGHIVEHGNHDELLAQGGFYAKLYNSQFEGVET